MTYNEKLNRLKVLVNDDNATDDTLSLYLNIAEEKILNRLYPYNDSKKEVPTRYIHTQLEVATYLYNKRGGEGEVQHSETGISRTYESADVPESMLRHVIPFVGIVK